jgi:mxaK protein
MGVKRRSVHLAFGAAVLVCAALGGYEAFRLGEATRVNEAIARASRVGERPAAASAAAPATGSASASAASKRPTVDLPPLGTSPEAQFARALAFAKQGNYDAALEGYKAVSRGGRPDLAADALYNAANLHFREALKEEGQSSAVRMLPLIELAKQSYRNVLRHDPQSWDARYNLERALWLSPELDESLSLSVPRNTEERVMSTLRNAQGELP